MPKKSINLLTYNEIENITNFKNAINTHVDEALVVDPV